MQKFHIHSGLIFYAATIAATSALVFAWIVDVSVGMSHWSQRLSLLACCLALTGMVVTLALRQLSGYFREASRVVDRLCRLENSESVGGLPADSLPALSSGNPWLPVVDRVKKCILAYDDKLRQSDHARARSDVRSHRAKAELHRLQQILDRLEEPVLAVDQFDELLLANEAARRLFALPESTEGKLAEVLACGELTNLIVDTRNRKSPTGRSAEIEVADADAEPHWFKANIHLLALAEERSESGAGPFGAVAVLRTISEHKEIQRQHAQFVSAVSHEMKTPLAGIKAYVELLADGDAEDEETQEEFLKVINGQADRLQRLIDNLLNLARIEAGVVHVNKAPRAINEILEEALAVVQPAAANKEITLVNDLSGMYQEALVDRDMLLQSAINLLSNAIKYTPEGGRVTLRSRVDEDAIQFEVEDTGVGLSPEDCARVFEKFYRVKSNRNMAPGTGLGLPLAKHIVEEVHGGSLTVTSEEGVGSTFRIAIPCVGQLDAALASK